MMTARVGDFSGLNAFTLYLTDIGRVDLLTREEEVDLARRANDGDKAALDHLVAANLRFVVKVATQYKNRGLSLEDLVCEGNLGLIKAAERFDETRGVRFISYAVWWIRQSILKALCDTGGIVRVPQYKAHEIRKVRRIAREIERKRCREPRVEEIARELELAPDVVAEDLGLARKHISLDMPVTVDSQAPLLDFFARTVDDPVVDRLTQECLVRDVGTALDDLTPREARVLRLYFGVDGESRHTLQAIGDLFGCTKENIRLIKEKALRRLRHQSRRDRLFKYHSDN